MRKVGFLGGSFNPIHFGHIHLGINIQEICGLDQVLVCPAATSPFKIGDDAQTAPHHRLAMVQLALEEIPGWKILDWEMKSSGTSFTIHTIRRLKEAFASQGEEVKLHLILGDDLLPQFSQWKEVEELVVLAPPLIGSRIGTLSPSSIKERIVPIPSFEVSSTIVRERLKKNLYCGHLVPAKVLDYIYQHQLYYTHYE